MLWGLGFRALGFRISLAPYVDRTCGCVIRRSPYTPYSIYLRGTIGFRVALFPVRGRVF